MPFTVYRLPHLPRQRRVAPPYVPGAVSGIAALAAARRGQLRARATRRNWSPFGLGYTEFYSGLTYTTERLGTFPNFPPGGFMVSAPYDSRGHIMFAGSEAARVVASGSLRGRISAAGSEAGRPVYAE